MKINKEYLTKNYWENNDPRSIMFHTTGGSTLIGAIETLKKRGLSYNYIIYKSKVYELVNYKNSAWHAGVVDRMNLRAKAFYNTGKGDENPNRHSVGIAFVQAFDVRELPEEDVNTAVELIKWLGKETDNRYTTANMFYHQEVTYYKPKDVKKYTEQVVNALIGDKDGKDFIRQTILNLTLKLAKLKLQLLYKKLAELISLKKLA